jgi:hypothetical protein
VNLAGVRAALMQKAHDAIESSGIEEAEVYVGSREVEYRETEGSIWKFGVTVSIPRGFQESLEDFDALMAGPHRLKDAIEDDRSLGQQVLDCDVTGIVGPQRSRSDEITVTEWILKIRAEE